MITSECPHCGASLPVRMPGRVSCVCGGEYFTGNLGLDRNICLAPRPREKPPRTFGRVLQALAGCGCSSVPWAAWDRRGLGWCRDNADRIAKRLASEPRTGLSEGRARELVQLAIEIADRQATAGQSANQAGPSG